MKKVILNSRENYPNYDWSIWRTVWLVKRYKNCCRIWSWREPFTRLIHKNAMGERLQDL